MSIDLISSNHCQEFIQDFSNTKNSLKIITPYLSFISIKKLLLNISKDVQIELITRFNREDFISGASNLEALKLLNKRNVRMEAVKNLHTKLYLFDTKIAITGSANLTENGLLNNIELSLLIKNEKKLNVAFQHYFDNAFSSANNFG